jgi:hypothetical protein
MTNENVNIQLLNLLLDLRKNTSVKGVHKQITDAIRSVTQDYQKYTITKNLKKACIENNINIPDIISQQERQYYSSKLKKTNYTKSNLINNSFFNIEHYVEIKTIKHDLLHKIEIQKLKEEEAISLLKQYFKDNVRCFFKLTKEDERLKPGEDFESIKKELVIPDAVYMEF